MPFTKRSSRRSPASISLKFFSIARSGPGLLSGYIRSDYDRLVQWLFAEVQVQPWPGVLTALPLPNGRPKTKRNFSLSSWKAMDSFKANYSAIVNAHKGECTSHRMHHDMANCIGRHHTVCKLCRAVEGPELTRFDCRLLLLTIIIIIIHKI